MTGNITDVNIARLGEEISQAKAILIGAGAGLSTAAGFTYSGPRFHQWFFDFEQAYGIQDMYSGGFYPFPSRQIYLNRYVKAPLPVYAQLLEPMPGRRYRFGAGQICRSPQPCFLLHFNGGIWLSPAEAARTAVKTVQEWLAEHPRTSLDKIVFDVYKDGDQALYKALLEKVSFAIPGPGLL